MAIQRTPSGYNPNKYPIPVSQETGYYGEYDGYVFDPWQGEYFPDKNARNEYYENTGLKEKEPKKPSTGSQLGAIAATAGTMAVAQDVVRNPDRYYEAGKAGYDYLTGANAATNTATNTAGQTGAGMLNTSATNAAANTSAQTGSGMLSTGSTTATEAALNSGVGTSAGGTMTVAAGESIPAGYTAVGTAADGSTMIAADSAASTGSSWAGTAALAANAAYTGYRAYDAATDDNLTSEQRATRAQQEIALGVANVYTFGLAGIGEGLLRRNKTTGKWLGKLDKLDAKYNPLTIGLAPLLDDDKWKREGRKMAQLVQDGVYVPEGVLANIPEHGRKVSDLKKIGEEALAQQGLPADYVGFDNSGNWINGRFLASREEKDLVAEDVVSYASFAEHDPDWFKKSLQERLNVANGAIQAGAVKEGHGTISVDWKKFDADKARSTHYEGFAGNTTLNKERKEGFTPPVVAAPNTEEQAQTDTQQPAAEQASNPPNTMPQQYRDNMARSDVSNLMLQGGNYSPEDVARVTGGTSSPGMIAPVVGAPPARGVRLSPGVYADGKGGSYRK